MPYRRPGILQIALEGIVVGVVFALIFLAVHLVAMRAFKSRAMDSHALLVGQVALSGLLGHLIFEVTGWNKKFCVMRE